VIVIVQDRIVAEYNYRDADRVIPRALHKMAITPFDGIAQKVKSIFLQCICLFTESGLQWLAASMRKRISTQPQFMITSKFDYRASAVLHLHFPFRCPEGLITRFWSSRMHVFAFGCRMSLPITSPQLAKDSETNPTYNSLHRWYTMAHVVWFATLLTKNISTLFNVNFFNLGLLPPL